MSASSSRASSPAEEPWPASVPNPVTPLHDSYTYHSMKPTASGPYHLGVDEAGRGPVLGPMVYGVAFCPASYVEKLEEAGFDDSKALTAETRTKLLQELNGDPENLGWAVRVLSPQALSRGMLARPSQNLNEQAKEATYLLIREVLASGIQLSHVFVDALGNTTSYQSQLSKLFPGITFDVRPKADSIFKVVGAASVAAKVTRDAWVENWVFEEIPKVSSANPDADIEIIEAPSWATAVRGSGYPSDPKTKAWIANSLEPTFGYPSIVRFSWNTIKMPLERDAQSVKWCDENLASITQSFASGTGRDKNRNPVMRELGLRSVGTL
ncbi:ribonuclease H-like protein [Auriculariales sp. MPI-PUGE-AT-0066]|nr:ribonuclease H-like protein [Auriculariales sp. MPI-PUGE-AT-0066]